MHLSGSITTGGSETGMQIFGLKQVLAVPSIKRLEYSASGKWLAIGEKNGTVHIVDMAGWLDRFSFRLPDSDGEIHSMRFTPDDEKLAIANQMCKEVNCIHLIDLQSLARQLNR